MKSGLFLLFVLPACGAWLLAVVHLATLGRRALAALIDFAVITALWWIVIEQWGHIGPGDVCVGAFDDEGYVIWSRQGLPPQAD
jgi:uncharacterized RDD family membrane protein YckC